MLPIRSILCPTDFSDHSHEALKVSSELAAEFAAKLLVLHVVAPLEYPIGAFELADSDLRRFEEGRKASAAKALGQTISDYVPSNVESESMLLVGEVGAEILRVVEERDVGLIVIATHGASRWRHMLFGSVTDKIVRLAPCPVLTVRGVKER